MRDQPSCPHHVGPTAPSLLPALQSCAVGTCGPALIAAAIRGARQLSPAQVVPLLRPPPKEHRSRGCRG